MRRNCFQRTMAGPHRLPCGHPVWSIRVRTSSTRDESRTAAPADVLARHSQNAPIAGGRNIRGDLTTHRDPDESGSTNTEMTYQADDVVRPGTVILCIAPLPWFAPSAAVEVTLATERPLPQSSDEVQIQAGERRHTHA